MDTYQQQAQEPGRRFTLGDEEIEGSDALVKQLLKRPWNDEFIIVASLGHDIWLEH